MYRGWPAGAFTTCLPTVFVFGLKRTESLWWGPMPIILCRRVTMFMPIGEARMPTPGEWLRSTIMYPACLSGQALIILVSLLLIFILRAAHILELWIWQVSLKTVTICTKVNGPENRCCIFFRIGIGRRAKWLMYGPIFQVRMKWSCF